MAVPSTVSRPRYVAWTLAAVCVIGFVFRAWNLNYSLPGCITRMKSRS